MTKRKAKRPAPARAPGPVTNRRKANQPVNPARARKFLQRGPANACPVDPDDADESEAPALRELDP